MLHVNEFRIPGAGVRRVALPLGKAGTLIELGIWGSGPDIRVGTGTNGAMVGTGGMDVRMGITDMAERFGMEPIPEIKQKQIVWDHFYKIYWYRTIYITDIAYRVNIGLYCIAIHAYFFYLFRHLMLTLKLILKTLMI